MPTDGRGPVTASGVSDDMAVQSLTPSCPIASTRMHRARWRRRHRPAGDRWKDAPHWRRLWTRFSLAGTVGATLDADAVRYGPGLPTESELKLLGHVEGRRVLELGCGGGAGAVALARAGPGSSPSTTARPTWARPPRARSARRAGGDAPRAPLAELAFVRADTIDAAVSTYGLATVDDPDRVFRQVHRVLRSDRPFVFSLPHPAFVMLDPAGGEPRAAPRLVGHQPRHVVGGRGPRRARPGGTSS